jgi:hypothetical protein
LWGERLFEFKPVGYRSLPISVAISPSSGEWDDKDRGSDKAQENNEGVLGEGFAF